MRRSRFNEEQIIGILKEHQAGRELAELCRKYGISDATLYKWRSKYGGLEVSEAKRLRSLELPLADGDRRCRKIPPLIGCLLLMELNAFPVLGYKRRNRVLRGCSNPRRMKLPQRRELPHGQERIPGVRQ